MSSKSVRLATDLYNGLKKRLKSHSGGQISTNTPISELKAQKPEDLVDKKYVDSENEENTIKKRIKTNNTANSIDMSIEVDVKDLKEATKVLKVFTNEAKKAEMALKSLTKQQLEAKRALNKQNLAKMAKNTLETGDNVASSDQISSIDTKEGPNCSEYDKCDGNCCEKAKKKVKPVPKKPFDHPEQPFMPETDKIEPKLPKKDTK